LNALISFFSPQTLKLIRYIRNQKWIILIDSGRTYNLIHHCIFQEFNCYIQLVNNIQVILKWNIIST
jgi:hypothetical protein